MKDIRVRIMAAAMCCVLCLALVITGMGEGGIFDDIDLSTPAPDPVERTDETYPSYAEYSLCEPDVAETDEKDYIY